MSDQGDEEKIECEVCKKHIPKSAAMTFEGADYTHYFCCTDCMTEYWKKEREKETGDK